MTRTVFILLVASSLAFGGCTSLGFDPEFRKADRLLEQKKYPEAIVIYEKIARESAGSRRGAKGLFAGAKAHVSQDNPHKDYAAALHDFDEFVRQYPDNKKEPEAQQWRCLVRTIVELRKNIEQLKTIDIKHEERRRVRK